MIRTTPTPTPTPTPAPRGPAAATRRAARVAGVLYLLTFVTSIPTLRLYAPLREEGDLLLGGGAATGVTAGALLEVLLALACVGTAVVLYPVTRRHGETAALGFVASRFVEAGLILVGAVAVLSVVTLHRDPGGPDPAALRAGGDVLTVVHDWTFLLGQSLMPVLNALFLGTVLYRSGLVPRVIPAIGLAGAPLLLVSDLAIVAGVYAQGTVPAALAALPIAAWELALGVWLVVRGFRPVPVPAGTAPVAEPVAR
jgi:hypothetical protein